MTRHPIPADLRPEHVIATIDSREQTPLDLSPLAVEVGTLTTGDYSVVGMHQLVAIERKSLGDALGCIGGDRERFEREVQRLLAYPVRALVVEAEWRDIEDGNYRSDIAPAAALGSLLGWIVRGLPVVMAGSHERAGRYVARMLMLAARRRWRENRALLARLNATESAIESEDGQSAT